MVGMYLWWYDECIERQHWDALAVVRQCVSRLCGRRLISAQVLVPVALIALAFERQFSTLHSVHLHVGLL